MKFTQRRHARQRILIWITKKKVARSKTSSCGLHGHCGARPVLFFEEHRCMFVDFFMNSTR